MGHCRIEAARSVLTKVSGEILARFHAVAIKLCSRTRTSQFGLLGTVLHATKTAVYGGTSPEYFGFHLIGEYFWYNDY
jgi:hypothetical protein